MPIIPSNLTAGLIPSAATSATTASVAPATNALLLLNVMAYRNLGDSIDPTQPTITAFGLTWVLVNSSVPIDVAGTDRAAMWIFRALGTPSPGTMLIDFAAQTQTKIGWTLDQFTGVDTSGTNGSGAIVQSIQTTTASGGSIGILLNPFADSVNNVGYIGMGTQTTGAVFSPVPNLTMLGSAANMSGSTFAVAAAAEVGQYDAHPTITWTAPSIFKSGAIAIEIKANPTNPVPLQSPTQVASW